MFVYGGDVGVYMSAHLTWMCDHIRNNELRREKLDIVLVSYGLLYQIIFVLEVTCLI